MTRLLSIPSTSNNKDLAWELLTLVLQPKILTPFHQEYGLLPTQIDIGEGSAHIKEAIDQVYNGTREPEQALDEAAVKSAKVLGW